MSGFDYKSGDKIAEAIDRRIVSVAKQVYEKSPNNKTKYGKVLSKKDGLFTVEIEKAIYPNVPALRNVGNINIGEIVVCMVPNNQFSNIMVLGVADGTITKTTEGGGSSINVIDNVNSSSSTDAFSANQGRILNEKISTINSNITKIEDKLVSKTSELENDGDGTSPFATEEYVSQNGGKIDSISVNGTAQTIDENKNVNLNVVEKVTDTAPRYRFYGIGYNSTNTKIFNAYQGTANYQWLAMYNSGGTLTVKTPTGANHATNKEYVDNLVSTIPKFSVEVVESLPTENISTTTVYLVASGSEEQNLYIEYIYINDTWEKLGEQRIDLSNYYTKLQTDEVIENAKLKFINVLSLPTSDIETNAIYLVQHNDNNGGVYYTEYIYLYDKWEQLGVGNEGSVVNILNNTAKIANQLGGFAGGTMATARTTGGAIGKSASTGSGGAVGQGTLSSVGFAGGYNAQTVEQVDETTTQTIDAIQLGTGTNGKKKSLQVYDDNIYDSNIHTLTVKNIELDGEDIKEKLEGNSSGMPVGSIFASAIPQTDARVHLLDGSTILQTGVYAGFATLLKTLVSSGYTISCTQSEFDADVTATGNCGKFVIDNTAGTIRLPKITNFIQGLSNITNIGSSLSAGLPNITGSYSAYAYDSAVSSGSLYESDINDSGCSISSSQTRYVKLNLDASRSSAVYGNSNTVQPNATQYPYYIVLASGYKSDIQVDIDNVMNELNNNQAIKFAEAERLKTINLFSSKLEQGAIASADGSLTTSTTRVRTATYIKLKAGTYTLSNKDKDIFPVVYDIDGNIVAGELGTSWITTTTYTFTITTERLLKFVFRYPDNTSTITPTDVSEIMLVEGSSAQSYQPYNGKIIHQVGGTMTGAVTFENVNDVPINIHNSSGDTVIRCKRTDTGNSVTFGVGSGGVNRGIYDEVLKYWLLYTDGNKTYLRGQATRPAYNSKDLALYSDLNPTYTKYEFKSEYCTGNCRAYRIGQLMVIQLDNVVFSVGGVSQEINLLTSALPKPTSNIIFMLTPHNTASQNVRLGISAYSGAMVSWWGLITTGENYQGTTIYKIADGE